MKCFNQLLLLIALAISVAACGSVKDVTYIQDADHEMEVMAEGLYDSKIAAKDLLTVNISASKPELVAPFNGIFWTPNQQYSMYNESARTYLVSNDGTIDLPVLGRVKLGGLTVDEAEEEVRSKLKPYLKETPSVNIRINNYRYSVIGEVRQPGSFKAENGKVTIFEALASAGDMTIYGVRDQVKVLREKPDGTKSIAVVNLKSAEIMSSPYYYLQQGDIIYVQPNNAQASAANVSSGVTIWFSVASIGFSLINLLVTLLR